MNRLCDEPRRFMAYLYTVPRHHLRVVVHPGRPVPPRPTGHAWPVGGAFPIEGGEILMMEEALIWLRERRSGKLVRAFLETARSVSPV